MMLIGELVDVCGIPATTLRFYEAQGLLNAERDQSGYRHYDESSLQQLAEIRILRSVGYSLAEIRELNNAVAADVPVHALAEHLERLDDHLALLFRVRAEIESILTTV